MGALVATLAASWAIRSRYGAPGKVRSLDPVPAPFEGGRIERRGRHVVLHVSGTPEQMGRRHGTLLKRSISFVLERYVLDCVIGSRDPKSPKRAQLVAAVRTVRGALPDAFVRELDACAKAAGVDPDLLLLAQCEGDVRRAAARAGRKRAAPVSASGAEPDAQAACTTYVAFGPATAGGRLEAGRNFDYWVGDGVVERCALVTYYAPASSYRFAAVGAAGILGGPTLVNEHGLFVAVHTPSRGSATRLDALPAFALMRLIAERASIVEEGIDIVRASPRMCGATLVLAQDGDSETGNQARAVAVEYDAEQVYTREAKDGVLIVTNMSLVFGGGQRDGNEVCNRYARLRALIDSERGRLDGTKPLTLAAGIAKPNTLHTVQFLPAAGRFTVWHGTLPAGRGEPVTYSMP